MGNITEGKSIDIANAALRNGVSPLALVDHLGVDDNVELRDEAFYQKYNNKNNPGNPKAPSAAQVHKTYAQAQKVREMVNNGYYRPQFSSPMMAPFAGNFTPEQMRPIQQRAQASQVPTMKDAMAPGGYQYVMNADRDAYEASWYAKPNADMPGGYEKVDKTPGWQNTPGKFVFEPNPATGGATKMAVLLNTTDDAVGRDVLSVFGPPEEYARNFFVSALGNIVSALPRLGENAGQVGKGVNNLIASAGNYDYEIFDNPEAVDAYTTELVNNFTDAKNHDVMREAYESKDRGRIVKAFNYLEQQLPAWKRAEMVKKRMPGSYNRANAAFNQFIDAMERLQTVTPDEYKNGAFDSWGSFVYNTAGVLADLAPQMTGAIGGAKLLGKAGSMVMGGMVGGAQAVGATMEAMQDAGFDINQQSRILPLIMTAMPLTEGLVSGGWMGRYLSKDIVQNYKGAMKEVFEKAYASGSGKLTSKEVVDLSRKSLVNFWENPAFKNWVQTSYLGKELPITMLEEAAQENLEDQVYNIASLYSNITRPEYYKDRIDSGVNDLWGDDGVFNPAQMLETTVLTMFATGISDSMRAGATGRFKRGAGISQQKIAQQAWAANEASKGNMGVFLDMARDEVKKETNTFGSKKNKLSEMGADNIVLDPETAKNYAGYDIGQVQEDGSVVIDNMADANALSFLQTSMMYKDIAEKNSLDGSTVNAKMLHEIIDVNKGLMSTAAIEAGVAINDANAELQSWEQQNNDPANFSEEQKAQHDGLVQAKAKAQADLDYYTKIEEGTQYSKAVNDAVKTMLTTYDIAERKTKEQMGRENLDLGNKKVYNNLKAQWDSVIGSSQNYGLLRGLMKSIEGIRTNMEVINKEQAERIRQLSSQEYDDQTKTLYDNMDTDTETITKDMTEAMDLNDDQEFLKKVKGIHGAINSVLGNITSLVNNNYLHPEKIQAMQDKYGAMYDQILARVEGLKNGGTEDAVKELDGLGLDEDVSMALESMMNIQGIDYTKQQQYVNLAPDMKSKVDAIMQRARIPALASSVNMEGRTVFDTDNDAYTAKVNRKLEELQKPVTSMDAYEELLNNIEDMYRYAAEAVNPEMEGQSNGNPLSQLPGNLINDILEGRSGIPMMADGHMTETQPINYDGLVDAFSNSYDVASRLDGKAQFNEHSSKDEQQVVGDLADEMKQQDLKERINTMRANKERFKQMAGITDLASIEYQQHKKAMILASRIKNMDYVVSIVNDGSEIIPKAMLDKLHSFTLTPELEQLKGRYDEKTIAQMSKAEGAFLEIMDTIKTKKVWKDERVRKNFLNPFERFKEWNNQEHAATATTMASAIGYDGVYNRGKDSVYDVDALRYDAANIDLAHFDEMKYAYGSSNKVVIERLQQYTNMLVMLTSDTSMRSIMRERAKLNKKDNVSTYEQEVCEDTLVGFLTGGNEILHDIRAISKKFESQYKVIDDLMVLPGDYGTGKTQHVLARALSIARGTGMLPSKTNMTFYAPSENLVDTHRKTFSRDNKGDVFAMFPEMKNHKPTGKGQQEIIVVDEGSLLTQKDIEDIRNMQSSAEGDVRILVLADLNQMKSTEEMDSNGFKYPMVMLYGFKAPTLTEQFSTLSPIIKTSAAYWKSRASEKNGSTKLGELPMGYAKQTRDGNFGLQYSTSENAVVDAFLHSTNKDKALILENQEQYDRFMDNADANLREAVKAMDANVFFIHFDKASPKRVIQGLRRQEVYIVPDYKSMRYHTMGQRKENNDFVAIYTAIGRATQYINMNVGAEASSRMTTDPLQAAPIGDVNGGTDHMAKKIGKMREANNIRFTAMDVKATGDTVVPNVETTTEKKETKANNNTMTLDMDGESIEFAYSFKNVAKGDKNKKLLYTFVMVKDGHTTNIGQAVAFTEMDKSSLRRSIEEAYDQYLFEQSSGQPKPTGKPVVPEARQPASNVQADPESITPTPVERPARTSRKKATAIKEAFMTQGEAWYFDKAVYTTAHFSTLDADEHTVAKARAMQAFILEHAKAFGLKLRMRYHDSIMAHTATGLGEQRGVVTIELDTRDGKALKAFASSVKHRSVKNGYVREVLDELKNTKDVVKAMQPYTVLSTMALPLAEPVGKTAKGVTTPGKADGPSLRDNLALINEGYGKAIRSTKTDEATRDDLRSQRDAQLALAKIRDHALNNHDENGYVDVEPRVTSMAVKVEYNDKVKTNIVDFINAQDQQAVFFDMQEDGYVGSFDDQYMVMFKTNEESGRTYPITLKCPFLDADELARSGRTSRLANEDADTFKKLSETSEPFESDRPGVASIYQEFEKAFKRMNIYNILMANRNNIQGRHEGSLRFDISSEFRKFFTYSKDGRNINLVGETLLERKENLMTLMQKVYRGEWKESLYDFIESKQNKDGDLVLKFADDQFIYTNAKRINTPHFYVTSPDMETMTKDKTEDKVVPEASVGTKNKKVRLQSDTADMFDTRTITFSKAQQIISDLLGSKFMQENLHLVNGRILYAGHSATGLVENQHMFLADRGEGIRFSTPYHETLHIVWNNMLTVEAQRHYGAIARRLAKAETGKTLGGVRLEEWMASDFSKTSTYHGAAKEDVSAWQKFKNFFKRLVDKVYREQYRLEQDRMGLDELYNDILSGRFKDMEMRDSDYMLFEDEEGSDVYEENDAIGRYIDLKDELERMFPGNRGFLDTVVRRTQYNLAQDSMLGNHKEFDNHTFSDSVASTVKGYVDLSDECGADVVEVRRAGDIVSKRVDQVEPDEYKYIYFPDSDMSTMEQKEYAQSSYRTWFVYKRNNIGTIMEHIVPEFNPETGTVGRGKLYDGQFSRDDIDPYRDGFTAEMKLHLSTVPMIREVNGRTVINSGDAEFVDRRLMTDLIKRAGVNAHRVFQEARYTSEPMSHYEAFAWAIDDMINAYGMEVGTDGRYISAVTQALKSFEARFMETSTDKFYDEAQDIEQYPLMSLANSIHEELQPIREEAAKTGRFILDGAQQAKAMRMEKIVSFMSTMASTGMSSVVTRNFKVTVRGGSQYGFTYAATEYDNNPFDDVVNRMKSKLDGKFSEGVLVNNNTIKTLDRLIQVDEDGNITVGRDKKAFITVDDKGNYVFAQGKDEDMGAILSRFNVIRNVLGLTSSVLPDSAVKEFLRNKNFTSEMRRASAKHSSRTAVDIVGRFHDDPRLFMAAFLANTIYTMKAQSTLYPLSFAYTKDGQAQGYNATETVVNHYKKITEISEYDDGSRIDDEGHVYYDESPMSKMVSSIPYMDKIKQYMKTIGASPSNRIDSEDYDQMGVIVPSQFYTAIDIIASQVSSMTGNLAGHQVFRPDGRKQHTLQGRNMMNTLIDGTDEVLAEINNQVEAHPELKQDSTLFDGDGHALAPYLKTGRGGMVLDHIGDFFGMDRDYGNFVYGNNKLTSHDYVAMSINMFLNKAKRTAGMDQIIITPTMTISDTGKVYMMFHKFNTQGYTDGLVKVMGNKKEQVMLNYELALDHVANEARKIDRRIELSRKAFFGLLQTIEAETGVSIPSPSKSRIGRSKTISLADYLNKHQEMIATTMRGLDEQTREKVMEIVRSSDLSKTSDVKLDEKNGTFYMGVVAQDNIPGITNEGSIYEAGNRRRLLNGKGKAENKLKDIFHNDFMNMAEYIQSLGFEAGKPITNAITKAGTHNGFENTRTFFDPANPYKVNEALFAYYMAFHITNNTFDDINGGAINYKSVADQVKRMGPQNTPKQLMNTSMKVDGHYIGSLQEQHPAMTVYDWSHDVKITGTLKATIDKATDGQSFMMPLYSLMFDISSGGAEYSVGGAGAMLKTLLVQRDPVKGSTSLLKHATKRVTEDDFNNSHAYRNMVLDSLEAQDQFLQDKYGERLAELTKDSAYAGFSWAQRFADYYAETQSMNKATKMLFDDMVNAQYVGMEEGRAYSEMGQELYDMLSGSVTYGYNPESTRKNDIRAINKYVPSREGRSKPTHWGFETMDSTQLGLVLNSEQPVDDSKKQSPFQQTEAFLGVGQYKLTGELAEQYGTNPGVAVNRIRQEIYNKAKARIDQGINDTKPVGVERQAGQPLFKDIDWLGDMDNDTRDLSYAMAQFEWYLRNSARSGMASASIQGNYVEMLSSPGITREIPQMRNKMVESYRKLVDKRAIKTGMPGMRTVQASGLFHEYYVLKDGTDTMPFSRQEALEWLGLDDMTVEDFDLNEEELMKTFTRRGLQDMRVENGETVHGECVMPYIYAKKLGVRVKGVDGATRSDNVRDLFTLDIDGVLVNVADMDYDQIMAELQDQELGMAFFDSFLVRRALKNMGFNVDQEMIDMVGKGGINISDVVKSMVPIKADVRKSLTVFANRVPSNRLGSGAWMDVVGFHGDGNVMYIPIGMTLLNDSDFDIDQLSVYVRQLGEDGLLSTDEIDQLQTKIMDITEQVFMAKENQDNIFLKSSIDDLNEIGEENNEFDAPMNSNSLYSLFKTYNDNKAGADAIGILANTLSATTWMQTIYENARAFLKGEDNPMFQIVNKARVMVTGKDSLVTMVGDWLQAALDNAKHNTLGNYGITPEAVNIAAIMIANGPQVVDGKVQTTEEFFRYIKDFFNNYSVRKSFNDAAMGSSLHYSKKDHDLYVNVHKHRVNVEKQLSKYSDEDLERENKTPLEDLMAYAGEHLMDYLNDYHKMLGGEEKITFADGKASIGREAFRKLVYEYTSSVDKTSPVKEQELVKGYMDMTRFNKDVTEMRNLLEARVYLESLEGLIVQAEALRGMSTVLSLRNGIPAMDSDILNRIKTIELNFGQDLQDIVKGTPVTEERFMDYYRTHSNDWSDNQGKPDVQRIGLEKAVKVWNILNMQEILRGIPMMKTYLSQMLIDQRQMGGTFFVDSKQEKALENEYLALSGNNAWDYNKQRNTFTDAMVDVALDQFFTEHRQAPVTLTTPSQAGSTLRVDPSSRFTAMDMRDIFDRQVFTLEMPNFVLGMQARFTGAQQMEDYFTAIDPAYAGISSAFYNEEGQYTGNLFVSSLDKVGRGDRNFVGLAIPTNTMSETKKRMLMHDFDLLPESVRNLFVMNEWIVNRLGYRNGSIIDIIGVDPYRNGLSSTMDAFARNLRSGQSLLNDTRLRTRFMDYVALSDGMTKTASLQDLGLESYEGTDRRSIKYGMPVYASVNETLDNGMYRKVTYKRGEDGQYRPMFLATSRAGISMGLNPLTDLPTIALTADEHDALRTNHDESVVKAYPRGHGFTRGVYMTDGGDMVKLVPHGYEVTLTKIDTMPEYSGVHTLDELDRLDQSGFDYQADDFYAQRPETQTDEDNTQEKCNS